LARKRRTPFVQFVGSTTDTRQGLFGLPGTRAAAMSALIAGSTAGSVGESRVKRVSEMKMLFDGWRGLPSTVWKRLRPRVPT
jgi:hypothetical protein